MSDKDKKASQVEARPLRPLPMPAYSYQDRVPSEGGSSARGSETQTIEKPDLSKVTLNFA